MELSSIIFAVIAVITVGSGAVVVFANRLIHAVFALLFTFFGTAGLYVFLGADFVAGAQVMVYVGGVLVLMVFGVMLTNRIYDLRILSERVNFKRSVVVVGIAFALLAGVMLKTPWHMVAPSEDPVSSTAEIGTLLMTSYLLPFEVAAMLLLAALIGASMLASGGEDDPEAEV